MSRKNYEVGFFGDPFFDDFEDFFTFPKQLRRYENSVMKTDIKEEDNNYILSVDIPGAKKEDISLKLENGYLDISYNVKEENDEKNKHGKFLRRERYFGSMNRSFYIGEDYKESDINASYSDGVLTITLPKLGIETKKSEPAKIEIK